MRKLKASEIDSLLTACDFSGFPTGKLLLIEHLCDCALEKENPRSEEFEPFHYEDTTDQG